MDAGSLRHRVALMRPVNKRDSYGRNVVAYEDAAIVRARIVPVAMREQSADSKLQSVTDYTVVIRFFSGLTEKWRVHWIAMDKTFEIASLLPDPTATVSMALQCTEVQ